MLVHVMEYAITTYQQFQHVLRLRLSILIKVFGHFYVISQLLYLISIETQSCCGLYKSNQLLFCLLQGSVGHDGAPGRDGPAGPKVRYPTLLPSLPPTRDRIGIVVVLGYA